MHQFIIKHHREVFEPMNIDLCVCFSPLLLTLTAIFKVFTGKKEDKFTGCLGQKPSAAFTSKVGGAGRNFTTEPTKKESHQPSSLMVLRYVT